MSDKASVIVRYEIEDTKLGATYKGLICNHYRGFDPIGLVSRTASGIRYMLENIKSLSPLRNGIGENNMAYQTIRRMFDVDFVTQSLSVSVDAVSVAKRHLLEGKISKDDLGAEVLWSDTDYGQLLIDITGKQGNEEIKYAFIDNIYIPESYTIEEYMSKYNISLEDIGAVANSFYFERKTPVFMNQNEINSFISMEIYDYLYCNEEFIEKKKDELAQSDLIESLDLSVRAYNCLKRAGIRTVSELRSMDEVEIKNIRNLGEQCFVEILEKL